MSDLTVKMHQNRFRLRLPPYPTGEAYSAAPCLYLDLRGPTSKGKGAVQGRGRTRWVKGRQREEGSEGKEGKKGERGGKKGGEEREREGDTRHTNPSLLPAPLLVHCVFAEPAA